MPEIQAEDLSLPGGFLEEVLPRAPHGPGSGKQGGEEWGVSSRGSHSSRGLRQVVCSEPQSSPLHSGVDNSVCLIRGLCISIRSKNSLISIVNIITTATLLSHAVLNTRAHRGLQESPIRPVNAIPEWKLFLPRLPGI